MGVVSFSAPKTNLNDHGMRDITTTVAYVYDGTPRYPRKKPYVVAGRPA